MSASTRLVQRRLLGSALGRTAYSPLHASVRTQLPSQVKAIAFLLPHRGYATEQPTQHGTNGGSFPPPGFNAEQAKKPLPKEEASKADMATQEMAEATRRLENEVSMTTATGEAKTPAMAGQALYEMAGDAAAAKDAVSTHAETDKLDAKKQEMKLTLWQKVKREVAHYWDGTKLLATEVRISSKLALKMTAGYELSRRENRQLQRTVQDLGRLVPFSVFVIVPFAELLLPVALKLFPNLLPSTYEGQTSKDKKAKNLRATRKEVSQFLRSTLKESGLPISVANAKRDEFTNFFRKVRATGESPTPEDVIKVCKIFKDDLTLDNLSRPQLVGMCRYMNLSTFGTDTMLRYHIRHRMRQTKRDDRAISYEGVDSLLVTELHMACAARGLRTQGMSPARLRDDLQMWLDLRLKHGIPSTLLVLSNAYVYAMGKDSEMSSQIEALQSVLSSIPEELFHEIELEVHNAEGAATNKQRLEVLKEQEELIEEENEQEEENQGGRNVPRDNEDIDEKDERRATDAATAEGQAGEAADAANEGTKAVSSEMVAEAPKSVEKK